MQVDLTPLIQGVVAIAVPVVSGFAVLVLQRLATRLGIQISAGQEQAFETLLNKALSAGAMGAESIAKEKGWDHVDVKNATVAGALMFLTDHAGDALKQVSNLDPVADRATIEAHLKALLPDAMWHVIDSPATTEGPPALPTSPVAVPAPPA